MDFHHVVFLTVVPVKSVGKGNSKEWKFDCIVVDVCWNRHTLSSSEWQGRTKDYIRTHIFKDHLNVMTHHMLQGNVPLSKV